jgi:hypothetical protein
MKAGRRIWGWGKPQICCTMEFKENDTEATHIANIISPLVLYRCRN